MAYTKQVTAGLAALFAATLGVVACSSSTSSPGGKPSGESETDAAHVDSGSARGGSASTDAGAPSTDGSAGARTDAARRVDGHTDLDAGTSAAEDASRDAVEDGGLTTLPPLVCEGPGDHFATSVVSYAFGPGQDNGQTHFPAWVLGPPVGGGACQGATTGVVSLGNGGTVTLAFGNDGIVDGPGPDFIVFENAFGVGATCDLSNIFAELATVEVSDDGITWKTYPCTATQAPYGSCAGTHVVYANANTNTIDPRDPAVAGGDQYDLADVGLPGARLVRITDRPDLDGLNGVFDLDAVSIVNSACP